MSDQVEVICGASAARCRCALPVGHDGAHVCGGADCAGSWKGTYGEADFSVVRWPLPLDAL